MTRMLARTSVLVAASLLAMAGPARGAGPITVQSLTHQGSGCPPGSVSSVVAPDGSALTVLFDSYVAEVGPGVPRSARSRDCEIAVALAAPLGWSWAIVGVDHRGFASLSQGVSATMASSFRFNRQRADHRHAPPLEVHFAGPRDADHTISSETPPLQVEWSACGGVSTLHISTSLRVKTLDPRAVGLLTMDSVDGALTPLDSASICGYRLVWRRCD